MLNNLWNPEKMSDNKKLIYLGYIGKAHGIRGEFCVKSLMQNPADIVTMPLQDKNGKEISLKLNGIKHDFLICRARGVSDRNAAEDLQGIKLYVERSSLPEPEESEYYLEDMKGLEVRDNVGKVLGKILTVHNFGAGDVIEIAFNDGESEMYPFTNEFFPIVTKEHAVLAKLYS